MEKRTARHDSAQSHEHVKINDDVPVWRRTTPRGNQEVDRGDMDRSAERLEMLLGH
jgi:hypothetical protein